MPSTRSKAADESATKTAAMISQIANGRKRTAPEDAPKSPQKVRVIQKGNQEGDEPLKTSLSVKERSKGLNRPQKSLRSISHSNRGEDPYDLPAEDSITVDQPQPSTQKPINAVHSPRSRTPPEASDHTQVPARPRGRPKKPQAEATSPENPLADASEHAQVSPRRRGRPRKSSAEAPPPENPVANAPDLPPSSRTRHRTIVEQNARTDEGDGSSNTVRSSFKEHVPGSRGPSSTTQVGDDVQETEARDITDETSTRQGEEGENGLHDAEDSESSVSGDTEISSTEDDGDAVILENFGIGTAAYLLECGEAWAKLLSAAREARKYGGPRVENECLKELSESVKQLEFLSKVRGEKEPSSLDSRHHTDDVTETIDQIKKHCRKIKTEVQAKQTTKNGLGIKIYNRTIVSLIHLAARMLRHGFRDGALGMSNLEELVDVLQCSQTLLKVIYNMKPRPVGDPDKPKPILKSSLNEVIGNYEGFLNQVRDEEAARTKVARMEASRAERRAQEKRKEVDTRRLAQQRRDAMAEEIAQIRSEDPWISKWPRSSRHVDREAEYDEDFAIPTTLLSPSSMNSDLPRNSLSQANGRPSTPSPAYESSTDGILAESTSPLGPHHHHRHKQLPSRTKPKLATHSSLDPDPHPWEFHELEALIDGLRRFSGPSRYFEIANCYSMEEGRPLRYRDMDAITQKAMWLKKTWRDDEVMTAKHGLPAWLMSV